MDPGLSNGHQVRLRLDAAGGLEFDGGGHLADGVAHISQGKIIQHDPVRLSDQRFLEFRHIFDFDFDLASRM